MSKKMKGNMKELSDDNLVELAKQGDVEAFTVLIHRYQERIYHTVFALTRNHLDADDLAQEVFLRAFKSLRGFKQNASFYTWIYRIAVNLSLNFLKKKKKEESKEVFINDFSRDGRVKSSTHSPEKDSIKRELGGKLKEAINSLPLSYRASFVLVVFQGMTHAQAGRILSCSENTVSWKMHKARKMLQKKLLPYLKERYDEM